ncbi:MAG: sodium:solute symporter [Dysgonamonadaceae bacterium]|jgi:SSS family solute:Na+ symporter|nr:sodium:solute symporter [Dysgonamonadaceae bacterium]
MDWNSHEFIWIDWMIIVVGIAAITWAVWNAVQKQKRLQGESSRDYFLGGEPWFVMGAAIFAANIGSEHLVGLAGAGAETGMGMAHWEMQGWMILILGWLFVPFYKHSGVFTMPEFLNRRYTRNTSSWLSIITLISYVLTKVSVTAFTGGIFMESLLGLPFWYGAIGLVLLTGVFTVFGGMKGVMTLSKIQTPILIIGSFLVLFLGLFALGGGSIAEGWTNMLAHAKSMNAGYGTNHLTHFDSNDPLYDKFPGIWVFFGSAIIGFWYWCTDQHIVQRVLGGKNMQEMRRGTILAGYLKILPVFMFLIPGMIAAALAANPESGFTMGTTDEAFGSMVKFVLPAGIKGIVTVGFICALVASLAAFFNSCATLYTVDFYKPRHADASDKKLVWIGRAATWVVVILGLVWIPIMMGLGSLYKYLQEVQSLLAPAIVAVFVMGIFSKKITPKAGEAGIIVGFVIGMIRLVANIFKDSLNTLDLSAISWFWNTNWLIFEIYLLVFTVAVMVVVSLFTRKANEEKLKGITFFTQSAEQKAETSASWNYWDIVTSLGVVAICILFYIYFW